MNIKTTVYCKVTEPGVHMWPGVNIPSVMYLGLEHRHLFTIRAHVEVNHDDRDVEFIDFGSQLRKRLREMYFCDERQLLNFGAMSCEHIGRVLMSLFPQIIKIEVNEDDENGAFLERV